MIAVEKAQALFAVGRSAEAVAELEHAAERGDVQSRYELGLLFLAGKQVPRDLARAREMFRMSGEEGHALARHIWLSFRAIGVGAEPDWVGAVVALRELARDDVEAAEEIALLDRMALSEGGDPASPPVQRQLSEGPDVWALDALFTSDECAYLIKRADPHLQPSVIVDPNTGELKPHPVRTSEGAVFPWVSEDLVIHALNRRIAAASGLPVSHGEPLQILRYRPGQQFRPHFDAYDVPGNQRVLTMLVYLNEDYEGGQTVFTHNGLIFRGRTGDGLLFRNTTVAGLRDERAQHAGLPVQHGEKWLASRWICERPLVLA